MANTTFDLTRYQQLQQQARQAQAAADQAEGAYRAAMVELLGMGFDTIEEAEAGLDRMAKTAAKRNKEFRAALAKFEEEWGDNV
jgi:multidrug resistance efflux pump